jgi:hypothetical protein
MRQSRAGDDILLDRWHAQRLVMQSRCICKQNTGLCNSLEEYKGGPDYSNITMSHADALGRGS